MHEFHFGSIRQALNEVALTRKNVFVSLSPLSMPAELSMKAGSC